MKRTVKFILLICVCSVLSACGFIVSSHTESGTSELKPLNPKVTIDGKEVSYEEGSYCWQVDGQGVCADTGGAIELTEDTHPLSVKEGNLVKIVYEEQPTEIYVRILKEGVQEERIVNQSEFQVPSDSGIYVVDVFSRWEDKGDQTIAFKIEVLK